jgi:hypothetical protein
MNTIEQRAAEHPKYIRSQFLLPFLALVFTVSIDMLFLIEDISSDIVFY